MSEPEVEAPLGGDVASMVVRSLPRSLGQP